MRPRAGAASLVDQPGLHALAFQHTAPGGRITGAGFDPAQFADHETVFSVPRPNGPLFFVPDPSVIGSFFPCCSSFDIVTDTKPSRTVSITGLPDEPGIFHHRKIEQRAPVSRLNQTLDEPLHG